MPRHASGLLKPSLAAALSLAVAGTLALSTADAAAQTRKGARVTHVTAISRYGNGSMTAPIRVASWGGYEVQLPGGVWIDCKGDCADELRRQKLDFWETQREERGDRWRR